MWISSSELHPENAYGWMSATIAGMMIELSELHVENADPWISVTAAGMVMERRDVQPENTEDGRSCSWLDSLPTKSAVSSELQL